MHTVLTVIIALAAGQASLAGVEVRFCPAGAARSYSLDATHGATSLVVQGIAVANAAIEPVKLDRVTIELLRSGNAVDVRTVSAEELAHAAAGGKALADSGMLTLVGFQFCDGALLAGSKLAADTTLQSNESLILLHQSFAWRGVRDALRVSAAGASATIPIDGSFALPAIRWPLQGGPWTVAAGASLHTAHR